MATFDNNGVELMSCICSKARFALRLKRNNPNNTKQCSQDYWERVVRRIAELEQINDETRVRNAIDMYDELINGLMSI